MLIKNMCLSIQPHNTMVVRVVASVSTLSAMSAAHAEDTGVAMLRSLLGGDALALITGNGGDTMVGSTIGKMLLSINSLVLIVAGVLLAAALTRRIIQSAQSGRFLGDKGDSVWFTLRAVYAAILLLPLPSGLCVASVGVVFLAVQGSNIANGILTISKTAQVGDKMFSPQANVPPPTSASVNKAALKSQVNGLSDMVTSAAAADQRNMQQIRVERERFEYDKQAAIEGNLPYPPPVPSETGRLQRLVTKTTDKGFLIGFAAGTMQDATTQTSNADGSGYFFPYISDRVEDVAWQRTAIGALLQRIASIGQRVSAGAATGAEQSRDALAARDVQLNDATQAYLDALDVIVMRNHQRKLQAYQTAYQNGDFWQSVAIETNNVGNGSKALSMNSQSQATDWVGLGGVYLASHATVMQTKANFRSEVLSDAGTAAGEVGGYVGSSLVSGIKSFLFESPVAMIYAGIQRMKDFGNPAYVQKEVFSSFRSLALSAQRTASAGGNPMALIQATGQALVDTLSSVWLALTSLRAIAEGFVVASQSQSLLSAAAMGMPILGGLAGAAQSFIASLMDIVKPLAMAGYIAGFGLALYIPAVPFIVWLGIIVSWLATVAEAFVGVIPWAAMHLIGDEDSLTPQRTQTGYSMLFALLLRPAVYVISFHFAAAIFLIVAGLANGVFPKFADSIVFDSLTSVVWVIGLLVLYFALMVMLVHKAFETAPTIADRILRWIGADSPTFSAEGRANSFFQAGVGRMYGGRAPRGGGGGGGARAPKKPQKPSGEKPSGAGGGGEGLQAASGNGGNEASPSDSSSGHAGGGVATGAPGNAATQVGRSGGVIQGAGSSSRTSANAGLTAYGPAAPNGSVGASAGGAGSRALLAAGGEQRSSRAASTAVGSAEVQAANAASTNAGDSSNYAGSYGYTSPVVSSASKESVASSAMPGLASQRSAVQRASGSAPRAAAAYGGSYGYTSDDSASVAANSSGLPSSEGSAGSQARSGATPAGSSPSALQSATSSMTASTGETPENSDDPKKPSTTSILDSPVADQAGGVQAAQRGTRQ